MSQTIPEELERLAEALESRDFSFASLCAQKIVHVLAPAADHHAPVRAESINEDAFSLNAAGEAHKTIKALGEKNFHLASMCLRKAIAAGEDGVPPAGLVIHDAPELKAALQSIVRCLDQEDFRTAASAVRRVAKSMQYTRPERPPALTQELMDLLDRPNFAHLATLLPDGSPKSDTVWVGREGQLLLVATGEATAKAKNTRRDSRVSISLTDFHNPYETAQLRGRVVEFRPDNDLALMDPISHKYTGKPFPFRTGERVVLVVEVDKAKYSKLPFEHTPPAES